MDSALLKIIVAVVIMAALTVLVMQRRERNKVIFAETKKRCLKCGRSLFIKLDREKKPVLHQGREIYACFYSHCAWRFHPVTFRGSPGPGKSLLVLNMPEVDFPSPKAIEGLVDGGSGQPEKGEIDIPRTIH